jgi:hypothetical protein
LTKAKLYRLGCVFALAAAVAGCSRNTEMDQLQKENPFKTGVKQPPATTLIVSCEYTPLQLPGNIDVAELTGWPGSVTGRSLQSAGFTPESLQWWTLNGFQVVVAPMQTWPVFRENILKAGGKTLLQASAIFRNRTESAEFATIWQDEQQSLFLNGPSGSLRGYTIGLGQCGFRVNCEPANPNADTDSILLNIVPLFLSNQQTFALERDPTGGLRQVAKRQELVFTELNLVGRIPRDCYICIVAKPSNDASRTLGDIFLKKTMEGQNYQMLCLLTPQMQIATAAPPGPQPVKKR